MDRRVLVRDAPVCAFLLLSMTLVGEEIMPTAEKGWALRGEENRDSDGGPVPKCGRCDLVVRDPLAVTCNWSSLRIGA
jgi:hypothetical protein